MKISELIARLAEMLEEHGDINVKYPGVPDWSNDETENLSVDSVRIEADHTEADHQPLNVLVVLIE